MRDSVLELELLASSSGFSCLIGMLLVILRQTLGRCRSQFKDFCTDLSPAGRNRIVIALYCDDDLMDQVALISQKNQALPRGHGRMVRIGKPLPEHDHVLKLGKAPHYCSGIPRFVEVRGGGYFFLPSLTALCMIAMGIIDPT